MSEVIVAGGGHFGYVLLRGQFAVKIEAEVADDNKRLNLGRVDLD